MATIESTINDALAEVLRQTRYVWRGADVIKSENSSLLKGSNARPDILVAEPNVSPVIVETEVFPARTVEKEAIDRLGNQVRTTNNTILSSIAVRLPKRLRNVHGKALKTELNNATDIEAALYSGSTPEQYTRWPSSGWLTGDVSDLSLLIQQASIPPEIINYAVDRLMDGVREGAGLLEQITHDHAGARQRISERLHQEDGEQTRRMTAAILINAFIFHDILAGGDGKLADILMVEELRDKYSQLDKNTILREWRRILLINYWPIFNIARQLLEAIPSDNSKLLISNLADTAGWLVSSQAMKSHDLTGSVFQRLISDRKFLAAYYTTPASASLLLNLAISPQSLPSGKTWSSTDDIRSLRIADFACGTGTLLSTAYHRISKLYELAGGNGEVLHPYMMSDMLVGCDVLPAAAHLTASMLSGVYPAIQYEKSSILTVAYGKQPNGSLALGSLDLLETQGRLGFLSITAKAAEGMGEANKEVWYELPHHSFDVIVMNPPFTRPTGHEGKKIGIPNPMFAAFSSDAEEQRAMAEATKQLTRGTGVGGNAGESSIFLLLADRKLKQDGMLGLIMPLSFMTGSASAWQYSRTLLAEEYTDIILISIAGVDGAEMSFSADTGMGECLVVGRKSGIKSNRATYVILDKPPSYPLLGVNAGKQIRHLIEGANIRQLEDGPVGGSELIFGDDVIGRVIDAPLPESGVWNLARIADVSLAQSAHQFISEGRVWLPAMRKTEIKKIPMTTVVEIGKVGPLHQDIQFSKATGNRGPFDIAKVKKGTIPTYPVLWSHDATRERTMLFEGESEGLPHRGRTEDDRVALDKKYEFVLETTSHCHFNQNFQFNSQSTAMQFTPRKTIGGRAWMSVQLETMEYEKALVLWGNSSFGILLHWWHANKQQSGRGNVVKTALKTLPVLDVTALSADQLKEAVKLFDLMCHKSLRPIHEIDKDEVRKELDERFARHVLGLSESVLVQGGSLDLLRLKLSREPSIRGKKQ